MSTKRIGALTIGQSPRPDLVAPLIEMLPEDCRVLQAGALDGVEPNSLPLVTEGTYPLTTRLRDGSLVMVEQAFIAPRLQHALDQMEAEGVVASILLCAGTFAGLRGNWPLIKPFVTGRDLLRTLGMRSIGLIAPIVEQETPIRRRWLAAGFAPTVWTADLSRQTKQFHQHLKNQTESNELECIVLDYVGHSAENVKMLQGATPLPVLDLGQLAMATLASTLH